MTRAYREAVTFYREQMQASPSATAELARAPLTAIDQGKLQAKPADQVGWWELSRLAESDPEAAAVLWRRVRHEAAAELASGHRAAKALQPVGGTPWDRARFLAIRAALDEQRDPPSAASSASCWTGPPSPTPCWKNGQNCSTNARRAPIPASGAK